MARYKATITHNRGSSRNTIVETMESVLKIYESSRIEPTDNPTVIIVETSSEGAAALRRITTVPSVTLLTE